MRLRYGFFWLCTVLTVLVLLFVPISAAEVGVCGDNAVWTYDADSGTLTVTGTGAGTLTVGGRTVTIKNLPDGYVILDCEAQNAYGAGGVNRNATISAPEFPALETGETAVSWTGSITGVSVIPRWWTL